MASTVLGVQTTAVLENENIAGIPNYPQIKSSELQGIIKEQAGDMVWEFIAPLLQQSTDKTLLMATSTRFNILNQKPLAHDTLINLKRVNDVRYLNKFFEAINSILPEGGLYINSVQTYKIRKDRILTRFPIGINWFLYFFDVLFKRVFPKLPFTKKIYFYVTQGNNRVLSKAETFGRLYSCGFEVVCEKEIGSELYFLARKIRVPFFDYSPTYGPLIRLKRFGKNGKLFGVYKARTMHPYSEYLQDYIYRMNDLDEGGKFKDDFRVTTLGKIMRKFWLDEFPMFINVFKGEMKLVGVRPLSRHYFSLYNEELKEKRLKFKPGLIPPFYVDMPKTLEEIMASEMRYLEAYEKNPLLTDWRYFWMALYNIFIKRARSK
ncbi:MAG: sugar transferase [Bacteroidales bacterium]|jgi:lipopolysaccharide/colanic/teichoic acid biosynthesis glycosyltransferase|nr:sugar transferase [Bacteroidales bacterium]